MPQTAASSTKSAVGSQGVFLEEGAEQLGSQGIFLEEEAEQLGSQGVFLKVRPEQLCTGSSPACLPPQAGRGHPGGSQAPSPSAWACIPETP